jgi:hypothetical protein
VAPEKASSPRKSSRRKLLIAIYFGAATGGYVLGASESIPALQSSTSTPLARVGYALAKRNVALGDAWVRLRSDVTLARSSVPEPDVFDLVVALRGLQSWGTADDTGAAALCQKLNFARCDARALEVLKEQSQP